MRRKRILVCFIIALLSIYASHFFINSNSSILNGTYSSNLDSFMIMSFDKSNDNVFYFYFVDNNSQQKSDQGNFYLKNRNTYVINSSIFINEKIHYQNNEFTITVNGVRHTFKKTNNTPTVLILNP